MYTANNKRYESMVYNRCGNSGLLLPAISLGLWQNFGDYKPYDNSKQMILRAFDLGITHFDLANNYGPTPGSAEVTFGKVLKDELKDYRDELIISTKAGYRMWPGPYGEWGSKKNLISSLDQSLKRMDLDYVDIFYSHRFDPNTPLEETMSALAQAVRSGKALYVGISSYSAQQTREAYSILKSMGITCLIHQPSYSMMNRWVEPELISTLDKLGMGAIAFSPLHQGVLTNKYLNGIPTDSRAGLSYGTINEDFVSKHKIECVKKLSKIAEQRGQSVAQLSLAWVLRHNCMTSAIIGASRIEQIEENVATINNLDLSDDELKAIDKILKEANA